MKNRSVLRSITFTVVCLMLGIIIALQLKSINSNRNTALAENLRVDELSQELVDLMKKNGELVDKIDQLTAAQRLIENETAGQESLLQRIIVERDNAELFAGLRDVAGPGGSITVIPSQNAIVKDSDLRLIVNSLRASGAQAIAINGERLVAMSEIITGGSTISINGRRYSNSGQFEIRVIMNSTDLAKSLILLQPALTALKENNGIDTVLTTMEKIQIDRLTEDSPAYRSDLMTPQEVK